MIITTVTPTKIPTHGKVLVEVTGTGFQPCFDLSGTTLGPVPTPPPSMRVFVGAKQAPRVLAISETRMLFACPQVAPGVHTVTVQNLALDGSTTDTATTTIEAARPVTTTGDDAREALVLRLCKALIVLLRETVISEVVMMTDADFGEDGIRIQTAKLPSITVAGLRLGVSSHSEEGEVTYEVRDGTTIELPTRPTYDVHATILGVARTTGHMANLQSATLVALRNNPYLTIPRDPTNPTGPTVQFEVYVDRNADAGGNVSPSDSGVQQFSIPVTICAVTIDTDTVGAEPGYTATAPISDTATTTTER